MSDLSRGSSLSFWRKGLKWARVIFTPLSLLVIALLIWEARASLVDIASDGAWHYLLASLLLWGAGNMLAPLISVQLFASYAAPMTFRNALRIHTGRLPAKYLPGGIWHSVGRANDYLGLGYDGRSIGAFFIIENFLIVAVTLVMSAAIVAPLIAWPALREFLTWLPLLLVLAVLAFPAAVSIVTRQRRTLAVGPYLGGVAMSFVYWFVVGLAFACYILAFQRLGLTSDVVEIAAIYIFSWCLGYLALFAPQGIGVSEFISGTLLAGDRATGMLAFLVGFRVMVLAGDLLSWVLTAPLRRKN